MFTIMDEKIISAVVALNNVIKLSRLEPKSVSVKFMKFNEEFGEFAAEVIKAMGYTHKHYDKDHLVEEAVDTVQVLVSILVSLFDELDIDVDQFLSKVTEKNEKWERVMNEYSGKNLITDK